VASNASLRRSAVRSLFSTWSMMVRTLAGVAAASAVTRPSLTLMPANNAAPSAMPAIGKTKMLNTPRHGTVGAAASAWDCPSPPCPSPWPPPSSEACVVEGGGTGARGGGGTAGTLAPVASADSRGSTYLRAMAPVASLLSLDGTLPPFPAARATVPVDALYRSNRLLDRKRPWQAY